MAPTPPERRRPVPEDRPNAQTLATSVHLKNTTSGGEANTHLVAEAQRSAPTGGVTTVSEVVSAQPLIDARHRVERIRTSVEDIKGLIVEAYRARDWDVLGYADWSDYCTNEFGGTIAIPREERGDVVFTLRDAGLSTRAIAAATDIPRSTANDLSTVRTRTVDPEPVADPDDDVVDAEIVETPAPKTITGVNGKTYQAAVADKKAPRKQAWPDAFDAAVYKAQAIGVTVANLVNDARAAQYGPDAVGVTNNLRRVVESLTADLATLDALQAGGQ